MCLLYSSTIYVAVLYNVTNRELTFNVVQTLIIFAIRQRSDCVMGIFEPAIGPNGSKKLTKYPRQFLKVKQHACMASLCTNGQCVWALCSYRSPGRSLSYFALNKDQGPKMCIICTSHLYHITIIIQHMLPTIYSNISSVQLFFVPARNLCESHCINRQCVYEACVCQSGYTKQYCLIPDGKISCKIMTL